MSRKAWARLDSKATPRTTTAQTSFDCCSGHVSFVLAPDTTSPTSQIRSGPYFVAAPPAVKRMAIYDRHADMCPETVWNDSVIYSSRTTWCFVVSADVRSSVLRFNQEWEVHGPVLSLRSAWPGHITCLQPGSPSVRWKEGQPPQSGVTSSKLTVGV